MSATTSPVDLAISSMVRGSGVRQADLARQLGMSRTALCDRLRGRTYWSARDLTAVAAALDLEPAMLLEGIEQ